MYHISTKMKHLRGKSTSIKFTDRISVSMKSLQHRKASNYVLKQKQSASNIVCYTDHPQMRLTTLIIAFSFFLSCHKLRSMVLRQTAECSRKKTEMSGIEIWLRDIAGAHHRAFKGSKRQHSLPTAPSSRVRHTEMHTRQLCEV